MYSLLCPCNNMKNKPYFYSFIFLFIAMLTSLAIGSVFIPPAEVWRALSGVSDNAIFHTILWDIRLPRTLLIVMVGAALAGSGVTT